MIRKKCPPLQFLSLRADDRKVDNSDKYVSDVVLDVQSGRREMTKQKNNIRKKKNFMKEGLNEDYLNYTKK